MEWRFSTSELDGNSMDDRKIALSSDEMGTVSITSSLTAGGIGRIGDKVPNAAEKYMTLLTLLTTV